MNLAIWDIESSSAITDFGSIIEIGGILVNENFINTIDVQLHSINLYASIPMA